ncbi:HupE/UreJ family protein [Solirubrobacter phytolaccae]|uniref:HupE/UreJ family protein n=1 Tax=Solirubrobacter phytolaccae TaxID=1404360 RepID=A0A9X3S8H8_9ACTN|nr:HupE/UreJ family protein [Solirubrobacter phytolaccae]MDA0182224.1 HupE/UreJ family protein [Solirubrobacter phytolaccae]
MDASSGERDHVHTELGLEYDLLVVSAADFEHNDALFNDGTAAFEGGEPTAQAAALEQHAATVVQYVANRFSVTGDGEKCTPTKRGAITIEQRDGVPYAYLPLDFACPPDVKAHELTSKLFPGSEKYVRSTNTIVTYEELDLQHGTASLNSSHPSFSTQQSRLEEYWQFFRLGAEHLYTGIDHILFLLALIAGSRRLRDIIAVATTFTIAHSVTFILAALGFVSAPASVIEPIIALSISVVAAMTLYRLWRGDDSDPRELDWPRLALVFVFGLVHGLGFASALGLDRDFSWSLLSSLLVFNLGIETVQLAIILAVFPVLMFLRRRLPLAGLSATGAIATGVCAMGLLWFVQRVAGV